MKNLTKIFMAIVMLAAYSCATDLTNDLGVQVNGDGQTTITLSLEETKTQLGEELGGEYPLYWSAGDKISVNGVKSNALSADYDGQPSATFTIPGVVAENYNIAYPAAGEGEVLFAENQAYKANNLSNGVTTMYAKAAAGEPVQLNNLTAILKIGFVGEATLTHAQISTIDRAPIAGAFGVDFESGAVEATDASVAVINYSFGEGVTLSSEPTYIHVAVPAGVYNELYVTLYDSENGVMHATVKADDKKPLVAGKLRKFSNNVQYAANDKVFFIKTYEELDELRAFPEDECKAILANDIVIPEGETWAPIENFEGIFNGNGYAIKGLNAPLFGTTSASIKGLHLEDVNIVEEVNPNVGAFARAIVATDTLKPVIENCTASGKITVKCANYVLNGSSIESFAIGGLVGQVKGVDIKNCTNNINIDVDQVIETANTTIIYPSVAGIVGLVNVYEKSDNTVVLSNLSNLTNNGAIDVNEVSYIKNDYASPVVPYVAGVAARFVSSNHNCTVDNITNNGAIKLQGKYGEGKTADNKDKDDSEIDDVNYNDIDPCLGGVFGFIETKSCSNVHNYGSVTIENAYSRFHYIGGIAGMCGKFTVLKDLHNHGNVTLATSARIASLHCAGVIAHTLEDSSLTNSTNEGKITANSTPVAGKSGHRFHRIGGVVGFADGSVKNCENLKKGTINSGGTIQAANNWRDVCFGGVVAYKESDPIEECTNHADITLGVNIAKPSETNPLAGGLTDASKRFSAGGVVGLTAQPCNNVTNHGNITLYGKANSWYVGGCVGDMNYAGNLGVGGYYNYGVINFKTHGTGYHTNDYIVFVGGCIGYAKGTVTDVVNNSTGTVQIDGATFSKDCYIGGAIGCVDSATGVANTVTNNAAININGTTFNANSFIGGALGRVANAEAKATSIINYGTITFSNEAKHTAGNPHIGGAIGDTKGAVSSVTNNKSGEILVENATFPGAVFFGGCVGRGQGGANATITNATNYAPFTVDNIEFLSGAFRMGGIASHTTAPISKSTNHGAVMIGAGEESAINIAVSSGIYVGGVLGQNESADAIPSELTNNGAITIGDGLKVTGTSIIIRLGGVIGQCVTTTISAVKNTGTINIGTETGSPVTFQTHTLIGGVVGEFGTANTTITGAVNEGAVNINMLTNSANYQHTAYGGMVGLANRVSTYTNCYNSGSITLGNSFNAPKNHASIGGFFGVATTSQTLNNCYNSGTIKVEAGAKVGAEKDQHVGGLAGYLSADAKIEATKGFRNIGNIEVYNINNVPRVSYVGGVAGNATKSVANSQVYCNIVAPGATQVGMIVGASRASSPQANNCKLGGKIAKVLNADGTPKYVSVWSSESKGYFDPDTSEEIIDPNAPEGEITPFWKVIYGGTWADASENNCDSCSYIGSITIQ